MNKNSPFKLIFIIVLLAAAVYFIIPSLNYYSKPLDERNRIRDKNPGIINKVFNLGLDLQGGMRLVLEVDRSQLDDKEDKDVLDRAYAVIENRINQFGIAEPSIQKQAPDRLIIELPGLKDEGAAKNLIGRTAQLEFRLLRDPAQLTRAIKVIDDVFRGTQPEDSTQEELDSATIAEQEAQALADELISGDMKTEDTAASDTAPAAMAGTDDLLAGVTSFKDLLTRIGDAMIGASPKNKAKIEKILGMPEVQKGLSRAGLGGNAFLWGHDTTMAGANTFWPLYYVKGSAEMRGDVIKDARQNIDQGGFSGGYTVDIEMNAKGAHQFSSITGRNIGKYLAIVLDSTVYSAPVIKSKIPLGRAQITGNFDLTEANNLAIVLRAGALPAPVNIIEERTVGPSLGQDSIMKGLYATLIGLALVLIFMAIYYKLSGIIADFALFLNLLFILAIMAGLNATLTLPGIAGLILIIGMSVDANVIIFERIREELAIGKTVRSAIQAGFERATLTIMDANITTLFTALILLWIGTGPIKGFAVTLIIGIFVSVFTALFITRVIFNIIANNAKGNKLSI